MFMIPENKKRKKILLIDDDFNVTQMLRFLLENRGYEVYIANSGQEALQKVPTAVDLVLLDLVLPDMDGFEVCRKFKNDKITSHIPIIILSARYDFADKVEGLDLGADDYLTKPFEQEELYARIEAVLRRKTDDPEEISVEEKDMGKDIRKIIAEGLIVPYFQPIYYFQSHRLLGVEVLSRPKVEGPLADPEILFKIALRQGLYYELEFLSWQKALTFLAQNLSDQVLFFNCNPYLIEGPRFLMIKSIFEENHIDAQNVIIEITERSRITDYKLFYEHLRLFRENGFRFAVDDVGGGFASLESIVETKPEIVKIDRHIVSDLDRDPFKISIIKFIVSFCKENNIISVAEGIETREQFDLVIKLGVDAGQGYFLCRPSPEVHFENMGEKLPVN
ncbi:MAG: EAL domain-containing protein [Candidatus Omnitrophota bacterium]